MAEDPDELLTGRQCAELLGIRPDSWKKLVAHKYAPPPDDPDEDRPANRRIRRWKRSTVEHFRDNRIGRGRGPRGKNRVSQG